MDSNTFSRRRIIPDTTLTATQLHRINSFTQLSLVFAKNFKASWVMSQFGCVNLCFKNSTILSWCELLLELNVARYGTWETSYLWDIVQLVIYYKSGLTAPYWMSNLCVQPHESFNEISLIILLFSIVHWATTTLDFISWSTKTLRLTVSQCMFTQPIQYTMQIK